MSEREEKKIRLNEIYVKLDFESDFLPWRFSVRIQRTHLYSSTYSWQTKETPKRIQFEADNSTNNETMANQEKRKRKSWNHEWSEVLFMGRTPHFKMRWQQQQKEENKIMRCKCKKRRWEQNRRECQYTEMKFVERAKKKQEIFLSTAKEKRQTDKWNDERRAKKSRKISDNNGISSSNSSGKNWNEQKELKLR